jgi:putative CocE/NonD family hydrolase
VERRGSRRAAALALAALAAAIAMALTIPTLRSAVLARLPPTWRIALSAWRHGVEVDHRVVLAMPDGTPLAASLYRPRGSAGRLPTVLVRLPYHRLRYSEGSDAGVYFAKHGYAVLVQDLRGTGDSGGELLPWRDAAEDGVATLDWIGRQAWSDGKVGTYGCSALGETQFALAREGHPAHRAMVPSGAGGAVGSVAGRHGYFGVFEGGVFQLASGFGWFVDHGAKDPRAPPARAFDRREHLMRLPVSRLVNDVRPAANGYSDFLATPLGDARWSRWGYVAEGEGGRVPALVFNTWGDQTVGDALAMAEAWRADPAYARRQKVVVAPGDHCRHQDALPRRWGDLELAGEAAPVESWSLQWFDYWLRGRGEDPASLPAYRYFMLGENRWLSADAWPPAEAKIERWYLSSERGANSRGGDGALAREAPASEGRDRWRYDPAHPVPSRGGPLCCTGDARDRAGPVDQADVESRDDVLVYTSAPLERALRIAGPLQARLVVSSDAPDTDLVVRLVDVFPDGRALNIQEGALRLRYRDGFDAPRFMEKGRRYEARIDLRSIAWSLAAGHRLRLQVASSSFPRLERNLNTGAASNADETRISIADNALHFGAGARTWIELPVLPGEAP